MISRSWSSWEWDNISDVISSSSQHNESLESESESSVWDGSVSSEIQIKLIVINIQSLLLNGLLEGIQSLFSLTSSNQFSNSWSKKIHSTNSFSVSVSSHVESLEILWIVVDTNWSLEDDLSQVSLVLSREIDSPMNWVLEFMTFLNSSFEELDGISIGASSKWLRDKVSDILFEVIDLESGVFIVLLLLVFSLESISQELDITQVVVKNVLEGELDVVFSTVHDISQVAETHFWLDHPEFSEMSGGVRVFGSESWTEGIDVAQRTGEVLDGELPGDGQIGWLGEKVLGVVDLSVLALLLGDLGQVLIEDGGDLEHFSSSLAIISGDDWGVDVEESVGLEKQVGGKTEGTSDSGNAADEVGSGSQMGVGSQMFDGVVLLGDRVLHVLDGSEDLSRVDGWVVDLHLDCLSLSLGLDESSVELHRGVLLGSHDLIERGDLVGDDNLKSLLLGSVVQFDEADLLLVSVSHGLGPSSNEDCLVVELFRVLQDQIKSDDFSHEICWFWGDLVLLRNLVASRDLVHSSQNLSLVQTF